MYPSANIVLFVNQEDYFAEIKKSLSTHPLYLCISYDTDLLALEALTKMTRRYLDFAISEQALTTEIRTKSAVSVAPLAERLPKDARSLVGAPEQIHVMGNFNYAAAPFGKGGNKALCNRI